MSISNVMSRSLMSASSAMKTARIQNAVKKQMEGHAGVLKAEIKQDKGKSPEKEKELEETEKKAAEVDEATRSTLSEMNSGLKEAAQEDLEERRAEKAAEKKKAEKAAEKKKAEKRAEKKAQEEDLRTSVGETEGEAAEADITAPDSSPSALSTTASAKGNIINIVSEGITTASGPAGPLGERVDLKV